MSKTTTSDVIHSLDILASVRVSRTGEHIEELVAYPGAPAWLEEQRRRGFRIGVRADPEKIPVQEVLDALRRAGLSDYFDPELIYLGPHGHGASPGPPMGKAARSLLLVTADADERVRAWRAGQRATPHAALVEAVVLDRSPLRFLRIRVPRELARIDWRGLLRAEPVAPLHVTIGRSDRGHAVVYAIAEEDEAATLRGMDLDVSLLGEPGEPQRSDLHLVARHDARTGRRVTRADAETRGAVLDSTDEGFLVAVPGGSPEPPGHLLPSRVLVPSRVLLEPVLPLGPSPLPVESGERILSYGERDTIRQWVAPVAMRTEVDRYSGAAPLRRGVTIASRDVMHLHNRVAVCSLAADLAQLGGGRMVVRLHPFTLNTANSVQCANVEAMLPRSGLGGVVIVCAHLDSRVDPDLDGSPHDPANDPAPGADDNASGIAGVLCAARALLELAGAGTPHREIRFVLFNAEERGLAGSRAYARDRRRMRDEIVAVFNMDMIGYDAVPPSYFEVHAGGSGEAEVIDRSRDLARLVARVASETCEKEVVPQFHLGGDASLPASGHSDHTSFHEVEYPACLICQDLHLDAGGNRDANCAYHTTRDKTVHACYAAEIARAVAAAAWVAATLPR